MATTKKAVAAKETTKGKTVAAVATVKADKAATKAGTVAAKVAPVVKVEKAAKPSQNPYREGGSYWTVVEALRTLGAGKMHPATALIKLFPKTMGEGFPAFKNKDARNENGKHWEERIVQNALVVNRPDYGFPLREAGWEVRKDRNEDGYLFGLFRFSAAKK